MKLLRQGEVAPLLGIFRREPWRARRPSVHLHIPIAAWWGRGYRPEYDQLSTGWWVLVLAFALRWDGCLEIRIGRANVGRHASFRSAA